MSAMTDEARAWERSGPPCSPQRFAQYMASTGYQIPQDPNIGQPPNALTAFDRSRDPWTLAPDVIENLPPAE